MFENVVLIQRLEKLKTTEKSIFLEFSVIRMMNVRKTSVSVDIYILVHLLTCFTLQ